MRAKLLLIGHSYIFLIASIYVGLFTSLHFFWFPTFETLTVQNYYEHIIAQTTNATHFFFITIPPMIVAIFAMLWSEWKTPFRWVPIAWIIGLGVPIWVQQGPIESINTILKTHVTNQAQLEGLLQQWMMLNHVRWAILTVMWLITLYYFVAKGRLMDVIDPASSQAQNSQIRRGT
jgi:hypothetical protein